MSLNDLQHITVTDYNGPWTRLEASDVPIDHGLLAYNTEYNPGYAGTRRGFASYWAANEPMVAMFNWISSAGNYLVYYNNSSGNIRIVPADLSLATQTLYTQAGASGAVIASNGTRLFCATFDSNGLGVGQCRITSKIGAAFYTDKAFLGPLADKPTLTNTGVGSVTAGIHRIGYIIQTRNGFLGRISPVSATTNLFDVTSTLTAAGGQQVSFSLTKTWPTEADRIWFVMTTTANLDRYYIVESAPEIHVPGGSSYTVNTTWDVSDADLAAFKEVTDNANLLTQDSSGNGPFLPFSVGTYGSRSTYLTEISGISQAYVSEPDNSQVITADRHVVYLPGFRQMKAQGELGRVWYVLGPNWTYAFEDTGGYPVTWPSARLVDGTIGTLSPRGFTVSASTGFGWAAHTTGFYLFQGGAYQSRPISYYVDPDWRRINWAGGAVNVQVVDNKDKQQVYVIAPLDSATSPSHILVFDYSNGITPEAIKYSLWYISGYLPGAGIIVQNPTTKVMELWLGKQTAGAVYRQMNSTYDASPYSDAGSAIDWQFETALMPGVNVNLGQVYLHQARQVRAVGNGTLACTVYGLDRTKSQATPNITLSTTPGKVNTNRYPMMRSESVSYRFSTAAANHWCNLSTVDHYYGIGNSTISPVFQNRKVGLAIQSLIQSLRISNPQVGEAFSHVQSAINDIYTALTQGQQVQDLVITDPTGRKIIELSGNGQITVQDSSGQQVAMLGNVVEVPLAITGATNAIPVVVTINGHPYVNGDTIFVQGATGNTAINGFRIVQGATTNTFTMTTLAGAAVNGNGTYAGSATATRYYGGLLTQTVAIGPSFANYKLRAFADGSLKINNAIIDLVSATAELKLDPTGPTFRMWILPNGQLVSITPSGVVVAASTGGAFPLASFNNLGISMRYAASGPMFSLTTDGTTTSLVLNDPTGPTVAQLVSDGVLGGYCDVKSGYKVNGAFGISTTQSIGISLNVNSTTIQYKDWAGINQSMTVVTAVSLNTTSRTFDGGILTS
jgi:hypothetical protein